MALADGVVYADSSALVKLVLAEPETASLVAHLDRTRPRLATSRIAVVEVVRAVRGAGGEEVDEALAARVLGDCMRLDITEELAREAALLEPRGLRSLDAIHLASALLIDPESMLVYDRRLASAASAAGIETLSPGA